MTTNACAFKSKIVRLVFCSVVFLASTSVAGFNTSVTAASLSTEDVLKQMDREAGRFDSLTAHIERTKVTVVVNDRSTESGQMEVRRDGIDQLLLLGFGTSGENLKKEYLITLQGEENVDGQRMVRLELTPRSDELRKQISKIDVWLNEANWLPAQQQFYETGSGDYSIIRYQNVARNVPISDARFRPAWPKGVTRVKPQD